MGALFADEHCHLPYASYCSAPDRHCDRLRGRADEAILEKESTMIAVYMLGVCGVIVLAYMTVALITGHQL